MPRPCDLDLLTLKVVSESHVTWATSMPILVFLGLSVLDIGPMYATDRQTDVRQHHRLMPPPRGWGITKNSAEDLVRGCVTGPECYFLKGAKFQVPHWSPVLDLQIW